MNANGMDWHNVPASERNPSTRHDCGSTVVVTTTHPDGRVSVGVIERDAYGLPAMRKGE